MATISVSAYNDVAARTAGESITITTGAEWTVRTDFRVHANAPASNLGSLDDMFVTEGKLIWDSSNIRWMEYDSGSGNVPAIGTTVSQGGVSGYFLGVWASKTVANTAVGAAMPTSGFIKFREVTGGPFSAGALSGIGASAVSPDVQGWISLPHDVGANFTVGRLGEHRARGGKFFLETTNGSVGQIFQIPTEGSAVIRAPGLWVETSVADEYEYWPGLYTSTNGWAHQYIGEAEGYTDSRQNFLSIIPGGQLQMGESYTQSSTYASLAAQASTYAAIAHSCTYTWENDLVTVYYATGHFLETGQQTGLDFTSGGATADDIYTVTVLSPFEFTVPLAGSGASGNVTSRPGLTITFTAHLQNIGESVYCDFTSGTGTDGTYEIYIVGTANTYVIKYPSTVAVTGGAVSVLHTLVVTFTSHLLAVGNKVTLDFTSGAGVDGLYTVKVSAANTYNINFPHSSATSGNVTMKRTIGNVAPAGRKTWIPSNIINECTTTTRATNNAPNTTITNRPEWITTSAGYIDLEYVYGCSAYATFAQAYNVRLHNCAFFETLIISECASAIDVNHTSVSMQGALDTNALALTSNFAGGTIANGKFARGNTPNTNDHNININYCKGITFDNIQGGIVQFARSTGVPFVATYSTELTFNNCKQLNGPMTLTACTFITINDHDHCDRYTGRTNSTSVYMFNLSAGCTDIIIDGITFGRGVIPDCHPLAGIVSYTANARLKVRNAGSANSKISGGIWAPNAYGMAYIGATGGNNDTVKLQRLYFDKVRTAPFTNINSDKNMLYESVHGGYYVWSAKALLALHHADLNGYYKGVEEINGVTGQASVYGTHFIDFFMGTSRGRLLLPFNEPTTETSSVFEMNSGIRRFNSSGGLLLSTVGDQATFTDMFFRKGHTGFTIDEVLLSGPTQTSFLIEYQIDKGSGFSEWQNAYRRLIHTGISIGAYTVPIADDGALNLHVGDYVWGTGVAQFARIASVDDSSLITLDKPHTANSSGGNYLTFNHLPYETIDPAIGFKIRIRITLQVTETVACAYLRINTLTSLSAQADNLYALDAGVPVSLVAQTITGTKIQNAQVLLTAFSGGNLSYNTVVTVVNSGTTATVTHTSHGLDTSDKVKIKGASHYQNNGVFSIVRLSDNSYSYTLSSAPGSNPTGTITATFVFLYGVTDVNGLITMSRVVPADQPVIGWARKSSGAPYYKTAPVTGTVISSTGSSFSALMIPDE